MGRRGHGRGRGRATRMAVVLPVPAGAMASWTRCPEPAMSRTRLLWRQLHPVGEGFEQDEVDQAGADDASFGATRVGDDALF